MGRIVTAIAIRLGKTTKWKNYGIVINKIKCIKYLNFFKTVGFIISKGKLKHKSYLLANLFLSQYKNVMYLSIFFYHRYSYFYRIRYKRILRYLRKRRKYWFVRNVPNRIKKLFLRKNLFLKRKAVLQKEKRFFIRRLLLKKKLKFKFFLQILKNLKYLRKRNSLIVTKILKKTHKQTVIFKLFKLLKVFNLNVYQISRNLFNLFLKKNIYLGLKLTKLKRVKKLVKYISLKLVLLYKFGLFATVKIKKKYKLKYLYKYKLLNGKLYKRVFKIIYLKKFKLNQIYTHVNSTKKYLRNEFGLSLNVRKKHFLLGLLKIEKMVLDYVKYYLKQEIKCCYYLISNYNFTAQVLTRYICIKLKQRFTINQIIYPLIKYLQRLITKKKILFGYRIELAGRFSRKQRAAFFLFKSGKVPLATIINKIDYNANFVILKDGVGSVKVWLNTTPKFKEAIVRFQN